MTSRVREARWPDRWRLQDLRIGVRLRLAFACVMVLMFLGCGVALWQFREIRKQVESVTRVEERMTAVLQLHNGILSLINRLHRAADTRQSENFAVEASQLLDTLRSDTARVTETLRGLSPATGRQAVILESLHAVLDVLPGRVRSLVELARAGDWAALHARLLNQVDHTDDVVSALVQEIDADLSGARRRLLDDVQQSQRRAAQSLAAAGLLSLAAAAFLGLVVTRSITRPLDNLDAGTRDLAQGHFGRQVAILGSDELAHLASVFNRAMLELEALYLKLRRSEAHFRSLIENASDLIMVVSRTGELLYASPSSARLLGYPPEKMVGRPFREFVHPEDIALADEILSSEDPPAGDTRSFELRFTTQDRSFRWFEGLANNLVGDPAVAGVVVNARDVSERRQAEQALRDREDQLRQAQKMEAIGRLAGGVAHDFNNLLTVINGYSEFLLRTLESHDPRHCYANEIHDAGQRAENLTRQLLAFGRKQVLQPAVLDLNAIIRDTERMLGRVIGEDVELVCRLDALSAGVRADPIQLQQILVNLSVNARDAMPHGGRLTIETANVELTTSSRGNHLEIPPGHYVTLAVSDTGHGMDEATRQRIFEPFFTTKEHGKGTGLGLSTVYGIVSQSGGGIVVQSELGRGTTFRIYLPCVEPTAAVGEEIARTPASLEGTETILLVEDQPEVRRFASTSLRSFGYRVIEAADGEEALQLYTSCAAPIHLLVTDVVMPGMTGVELSNRLQLLNPLKVLFVSGYADSVMLRCGVLDASFTLLQKPYTREALAAKIREVLGSQHIS